MLLIQRAIVLNVLEEFGGHCIDKHRMRHTLRQAVDTAAQRLSAPMGEANTVELLWLAYIFETSALRIKTLFSTH